MHFPPIADFFFTSSTDFGRLNKCRRRRRSNGNGNPIWKGAAIKRIFIEFTSCPHSPLHSPLLCTDRVEELLHYAHFGLWGEGGGSGGRGESPKRSEQAVTLCKVNRFPPPLLSSPLTTRSPSSNKPACRGMRQKGSFLRKLCFSFHPSRGDRVCLLPSPTPPLKPVRPPR